MNRKKRSPIWKMPQKQFIDLVNSKSSFKEILNVFNLENKGGNHRTLKKRIQEEGINVDRIYEHFKNRIIQRTAVPNLDSVMIKNSTYNRGSLKRRLIEGGILENRCNKCGQGNEWNGKQLVLVLDHINGQNNDHRLENLQLLCPNCNSQQDTFAGRKTRKGYYYCKDCGTLVSKITTRCRKCYAKFSIGKPRISARKCKRPPRYVLLKEVQSIGFCAVGRKYGVSDNAVRKWLKLE